MKNEVDKNISDGKEDRKIFANFIKINYFCFVKNEVDKNVLQFPRKFNFLNFIFDKTKLIYFCEVGKIVSFFFTKRNIFFNFTFQKINKCFVQKLTKVDILQVLETSL